MKNMLNRRQFINRSAAGMALAYSAGIPNMSRADGNKVVRVGFVGVGRRGSSLIKVLMHMDGVEIPAMCDINTETLAQSQDIVVQAGRKKPEGYSRGGEDYKRMVERDDLDAVITATPWELHTPVMVAAMKAGKYGATEVNAGITVEECWDLVRTSEETGMPCMMLENVCYFRDVMMILNMVSQGLFGELIHCEAGYQHYIPSKIDTDSRTGEMHWRGKHSVYRNGNIYPTHQLGPVAQWLDINRGDKFDYLVSMSSKSRGLNHYSRKKHGPGHPNATRTFENGDINVTLIKTHNGATVTLYHDTQLPRPYDLILRVQGTEGICMGYDKKIYLEERSGKKHQYQELDEYREEFEHPVWRKMADNVAGFGHGGSDFLTLYSFIKAVREKTQTPIDVYDSAVWSVIFPLSERSVAERSKPVEFPDFTGGKWRAREPIGIVNL